MLLEHLGARRQKHAAKLRAAVRQKGSKLRKRLKGISTEFEKLLPEASANVAGLAVKLSTELASPAGLNKRNLHPYRLKVKELRNVLQMGRQRRSTGVHRHAGRAKRCHRRVARLAGAHRNSRGYSRPRTTMPTAARARANQRGQISTPGRRPQKKISSRAPSGNWPHPRPSPSYTCQTRLARHGRASGVKHQTKRGVTLCLSRTTRIPRVVVLGAICATGRGFQSSPI